MSLYPSHFNKNVYLSSGRYLMVHMNFYIPKGYLIFKNRILDGLHLALTIHCVYAYSVTGFGNIFGLTHIVWSVKVRVPAGLSRSVLKLWLSAASCTERKSLLHPAHLLLRFFSAQGLYSSHGS